MTFDKRKALQVALVYTQQGRLDKAIAEYEAILKADPNDLSIYNLLGDLYARTGAASEAIAKYLKLGELYRADGLAVKAIAVYKKVVKLDPRNVLASLACADLYAEQGLIGEAKLQYTVAAEHYLREGRVRKALELYQRIADLDPGNVTILSKLAELYAKEGMIEEAVSQLHKAAETALKARKDAEAKRFFKRMAELDPSSFKAHYGLARLLVQMEAYDEAVEALRLAERADPTSPLAPAFLGEIQRLRGELSEAEAAFRRALQLDPSGVEARLKLGRIYLERGRVEEAFETYAILADRFRQEGRYDDAIELFRGILEADPKHLKAEEQLSELLTLAGDLEGAKEGFRRLAALHREVERADKEAVALRRVLALDPADALALGRLRELGVVEEDRSLHPEMVEAGPSYEEEVLPIEAPPLEEQLQEEVEGGIKASEEALAEGLSKVEVPTEPEVVSGEDPLVLESLIEVDVYLKYSLYERAVERLRQATALVPRSLAVRSKLKELYLERGMLDEAAAEGVAMAEIALEQGLPSQAALELTKVLALDPQHARARELYASLMGEEELPKELQPFLVEEPEEVQVVEEGPDLSEDVAEADFYLSQGMVEEAKGVLRRILIRDPGNAQATKRLSELELRPAPPEVPVEFETPPAKAPSFDVTPVFKVASEEEEPEGGFIDLSAELERELAEEEVPRQEIGPPLEEILAEFQKGIREKLSEEDYETHYNLGIAYKEMDLFDEAIEEFRLAAKDRRRALTCIDLIGLCYMAKGRPELAVQELMQGLVLSGFPPEEYRGLKYDLATAYEVLGDLQKALTILQELEKEDPRLWDVAARIRDLKGRLQYWAGGPARPFPSGDPSDRISFL